MIAAFGGLLEDYSSDWRRIASWRSNGVVMGPWETRISQLVAL
jgi:hypothetical protein